MKEKLSGNTKIEICHRNKDALNLREFEGNRVLSCLHEVWS